MSKSNGAKQFGNKSWPHAAEALLRGRLVYVVKFYGDQEVDQPKGTEPIKEAIRKMKFNKQLRKAEGQKTTPKVELHINVDGISIQEPKTKVQQYKFPLHHISYCADDKTEKKLFTFIAKDGATGRHHCFVLGSEKNAEEITLTIGQAFDLAYKRFLEKQTDGVDKQKQFLLLQQQVQKLQEENKALKARIAELESERTYTSAMKNGSTPSSANGQLTAPQPLQAPAGQSQNTSSLFDDDFNPSTSNNGFQSSAAPVKLAPPPAKSTSPTSGTLSAAQPSAQQTKQPTQVDAFGMPSFNPNELMEFEDMRSGFSRGLSFGVEDFDLNSLDPLNQ